MPRNTTAPVKEVPSTQPLSPEGKYALVRSLVCEIPAGEVASYGMIASILPGVTARMVGFVMAGLPDATDVPWQRVINAGGGISPRTGDLVGDTGNTGAALQRRLLEAEGVVFSATDKIDWATYAWAGPDPIWLEAHGIDLAFFMDRSANWPAKSL